MGEDKPGSGDRLVHCFVPDLNIMTAMEEIAITFGADIHGSLMIYSNAFGEFTSDANSKLHLKEVFCLFYLHQDISAAFNQTRKI